MTSALNENKLQGGANAHIKRKETKREKSAIITLLEKSEIIKYIYEYEILIIEKHTINSYSLKIHCFLK